jgi:hypothetical protein
MMQEKLEPEKKSGKIQKVDWTNEAERPHKGLLNMLPRWMRSWTAPGVYNYDREMARRRRQIESGTLKKENGLHDG